MGCYERESKTGSVVNRFSEASGARNDFEHMAFEVLMQRKVGSHRKDV